MIIVQMMGNLGNQLFIYAMARALQLEYGDDIVFDLGGLKRFYYSASYKLNHLNLPEKGISCNMNSIPIRIRRRYERSSKVYHLEQKIYRQFRKDQLVPDSVTRKWFRRGCYYNFSRSYFDYPKCNSDVKFVYGYFQNTDYFKQYDEQIKRECRVIDEIDDYDKEVLPRITGCNSVAVSMRAINEIGVSFIDFDYYFRAMELIAQKTENPVFYVFSDDIEAVRKLEFPFPVEFVTPADACHGLRLLYSCRHFVIANSTFSWWGAYLSDNPGKIIVMPDKIDKSAVGREGYYLDNAIRLPCSFVDYKLDMDQILHKKYAK